MKQTRRGVLGAHELANHMNNGLENQVNPQHLRRGNNNYNDGYRDRMQQQQGMHGSFARDQEMMKDPQLSVPTNSQIEYEVPCLTRFDAMGPVNLNPSSEKWISNKRQARYSNSWGEAQKSETAPFFNGSNQMYDFPSVQFD